MSKVEIVSPDAIIDLKVGSKFLQDLQAVLLYLSSLQSVNKLQDILEKVKVSGETSLDDWEKSMYTMLVLISSLEENARTAGFTRIEDIPESGLSAV
jgi:hypothetical protein